MERLTKLNPETGQYEYKEPAKTQEEFIAQRKAVIQKLGEFEDRAEGRWIDKCCSVCGEKQPYTARGNAFATTFYQFKTKFCPNCGAKMKGEKR